LLSEEVVKQTLSAEVKPINPHSQRLLAAEARSAKAAPKPGPKAKAGSKAKAKAGSKPKPKAKASANKRKGSGEKKSDDNNITPSRTEYSAAKKKWMDENLDSRKVAALPSFL